jgi:hypothetical protein
MHYSRLRQSFWPVTPQAQWPQRSPQWERGLAMLQCSWPEASWPVRFFPKVLSFRAQQMRSSSGQPVLMYVALVAMSRLLQQ